MIAALGGAALLIAARVQLLSAMPASVFPPRAE